MHQNTWHYFKEKTFNIYLSLKFKYFENVGRKKRNNPFTCNLNYVRAKMVVLDISTEIKEKMYVMPLLHM